MKMINFSNIFKKLVASMVIAILAGHPVLASGNIAHPQNIEKKAETYCGSSKKVEFGFKNEKHTKFLIPEAYLYDPFGQYYKPEIAKDPIDFISVQMNKESGAPNCDQKSNDLYTFLPVNIFPIDSNNFKNIFYSEKSMFPFKVKDLDNTFYVYRDNNKPGELVRDILIPINTKKEIFFKCGHGLEVSKDPLNNPPKMSGCTVFSKSIGSHYYLQYTILPKNLSNYEEIDNVLSNKILNFEKI